MASNDKSFRAAFSMPLASQSSTSGKSSLSINIPKAFLLLALLMLVLLAANLGLACVLTFECGKFVPGPGYLGCFRGYDRIFIAACSYYGLVLPIMVIGFYGRFTGLASDRERSLLLWVGLVVCFSLPILAMTDEKNAVHVLPFEPIYSLAVWVFVGGSILWTGAAYWCISRGRGMHNVSERRWFICLRILILLTLFTGVLMVFQWKYSYTKHENWYLNAWMGSVSEWVLTVISVLSPVVFCQFLRGFSIAFTTQVAAPYERLEVEMKKLEN